MVEFTPRPLYSPGNTDRYPLERMLGGLHSRYEPFFKKINSSLPPVFDTRAVQPVASRDTACTCSVCPLIPPLAVRPASAMNKPVGRCLPTIERHLWSLETQ